MGTAVKKSVVRALLRRATWTPVHGYQHANPYVQAPSYDDDESASGGIRDEAVMERMSNKTRVWRHGKPLTRS
jgi:hypothetical protein